MPTADKIDIDSLTREEALGLVRLIEAKHGGSSSKVITRAPPPTEEPDRFYEAWLLEHASLLDSLPTGTVVAIRFPEGDYVTATDGLAAMDAFQQRFGTEAKGWVHHVRAPVIVGGGYWQISSGA